jgi:dihydrofolate synthase/folylpolyglutamate synthase
MENQRMAFTTYEEALKFLFSFTNYERVVNFDYDSSKLNLRRMTAMLEYLGNPHLAMHAVHITGTKGKGSTALMLTEILKKAGIRSGTYMSPHLVHLEERILVDGEMIPKHDLVKQLNNLVPHLEAAAKSAEPFATPTFFEIFTGMAWNYFRERAVQVAVMEVGLGGRLDSTNVIRPDVCVITNVSFDHMRQLGDTLARIATEKAGIIKPGVPVLSAVDAPEALRVVETKCRELTAPLYLLGREIILDEGGNDFSVAVAGRRVSGLRLRQPGAHQRWNAALAAAAAVFLSAKFPALSEPAVRAGLEAVELPGRIETVHNAPTIIIDGAHNVASLKCLLDTVREQSAYDAMTLVFAVADDKDISGMIAHIVSRAAEMRLRSVILTRTGSPRAASRERLVPLFEKAFADAGIPVKIEWRDDVPAVYADALTAAAKSLTCFTGSTYLAGMVRQLLPQGPLTNIT